MNFTKLSGGSWTAEMGSLEGGGELARESTVETFMRDTAPTKIAASVGDLLQLTRERQARQFIGQSASTPALGSEFVGSDSRLGTGATSRTGTGRTKRSSKPTGGGVSSRKAIPGVSYTIQERPPNRADIAALDRELESRVQAILSLDQERPHSLSMSDLYDPHRDTVTIIREKLLHEFRADHDTLEQEPWLDRLIKCECIKITCDEIAVKMVDMVSVSSTELGQVMRKLRLSYKQSFDQMRKSWQGLRSAYLRDEEELRDQRDELDRTMQALNNREHSLRLVMDQEIDAMTIRFNQEREQDRAALAASEFKMEQMADTLQSLNGIFKTMQTDGTVTKVADLSSKCQRLQKENDDLSVKVLALDKYKNDLSVAEDRIAQLEREARQRDMELTTLKAQMARREETVVALMEKESLRMAEIEKLKSMANMQDDNDDGMAMDFKEPATAVLCVKCKKGLDDIANIRAAVLGKGNGKPFQCENFRVLLPNLRGRRPDRPTDWVRNCMRCILVAKMREDVSLLGIKGDSSRFPQFVYAWFDRTPENYTKGAILAAQHQSDEDRWGLYYGVKALVREGDAEASVFWALLDETHGEDGMQFVFHCMSMALSYGGGELWRQFGPCLTNKSSSINSKPEEVSVRANVWLDLGTATEALKAILVRALKPHLQEAIDAIYALKVVPSIVDPQVREEEEQEAREAAEAAEASAAAAEAEEGVENEWGDGGDWNASALGDDESGALKASRRPTPASRPSGTPAVSAPVPAPAAGAEEEGEEPPAQNPTHINFFMWIRLLVQQVQAEQIHRAAAVRLMFESASVGALTPQLASASDPLEPGTSGSQLEFPQFLSICRTLFPTLSQLDCASLYGAVYDEGRRKVTADALLKVGDRLGLFSKAMRLATLPLLEHNLSVDHLKRAMVESTPQPSAGSAPAALADVDPAAAAAAIESSSAPGGAEGVIVLRTGAFTREELLRGRLGALVHRKLAAITPDLLALTKRVPARWAALILEARDQVLWALNDAFDKIKRSKSVAAGAGREEEGDPSSAKPRRRPYIDGIQPYIHYRRLLSIALLVKSLSDNPLLPAELFLGKDRSLLPSLDLGLKQAENLLSALEDGLVTTIRLDSQTRKELSQGATNEAPAFKLSESLGRKLYGDKGVSRVFKFEAARRSLVARRLQTFFLKFSRDDAVPVPARLRRCVRSGYLRGARGLRARKGLSDPWSAQCAVAEILAFKLTFDSKASRLGVAPIPLEEASVAALFLRWGSLDVAERALHDLCLACRTHSNSPRLRLFAALVGMPCDLDPAEAALLSTPQAVAVCLSLVLQIHRAVAIDDAAAVGATDSLPATLTLPVLFPSKGPAHDRADKSDRWGVDGLVLVSAVSTWARALGGLDEEALASFSDLAEFARGHSPDGTADADEVMWVAMNQWARYAQWYSKRASARSLWNSTNAPVQKVTKSASQMASIAASRPVTSSAAPGAARPEPSTQAQAVAVAPKPTLAPPINGAYLRSLVESVHPAGLGQRLADPVHYTAKFTASVAAAGGASASYVTVAVEKMLRSCALWDTNANKAAGDDPAGDKTLGNAALASLHDLAEVSAGTTAANSLSALVSSLATYSASIKSRLAQYTQALLSMHSPELERGVLAASNALDQLHADVAAAAAADLEKLKSKAGQSLAASLWAQLHDVFSAVDDLVAAFAVFNALPGADVKLFPLDDGAEQRAAPVVLPACAVYALPMRSITG